MATRVAGSLWTPRLVWAVNVIGDVEGRAETLRYERYRTGGPAGDPNPGRRGVDDSFLWLFQGPSGNRPNSVPP